MLLRLECITCASWGVSRILRKALRKNLFREYCEYHTHPRIFCKPFGLRFGTILQPQLSLPPSPNPPPATKLQYFFQSIAPAKKKPLFKGRPTVCPAKRSNSSSSLLLCCLCLYLFRVILFHVSTHMRARYQSTHMTAHSHESTHAPNI